ncbi:MAG: ABC transporter permease [Gammaproteobacteria bacterium]|nr:ABC transporter permease [Gammaproteobacteria bacterium]
MKLASYRVAFHTLVHKEIMRIMRIWVQTLVPPAITMTLYFVIFGNLIGSRIGQMGGHSYMEYIVPGLIMLSVITNAYANVVTSFFGAKFGKHIEELLISPVPNWVILWGYVLGGMARSLAIGVIVTIISLFFTRLQVQHWGITISVLILTSILFSLAGFVNAVFAQKFDDISIVPTFVLTPLTYLGGIFYSVQLLPEFWQKVSMLNPILHMVNAFRYGILGVSDIPIATAYSIICIFIVLFYCICLRLLQRGVGLRT